jgi:hypothetical protein
VPKAINPLNEDYSPVEKFMRGRFYTMMRTLQHEGARAWQHYKRLYIFTGTWFEKIDTLDELFQEIQDVSPCETLLRCFNILCPYDQELPRLLSADDYSSMETAW